MQLLSLTLCICCAHSGAILGPWRVIGVINSSVLLASNAQVIKASSCVFALEGVECRSLLLTPLQSCSQAMKARDVLLSGCPHQTVTVCYCAVRYRLRFYLGSPELALQLLHRAGTFAKIVDDVWACESWLSLQWPNNNAPLATHSCLQAVLEHRELKLTNSIAAAAEADRT